MLPAPFASGDALALGGRTVPILYAVSCLPWPRARCHSAGDFDAVAYDRRCAVSRIADNGNTKHLLISNTGYGNDIKIIRKYHRCPSVDVFKCDAASWMRCERKLAKIEKTSRKSHSHTLTVYLLLLLLFLSKILILLLYYSTEKIL